ncbi:MAG: hypothetical protein AAB289_15390, partial [Chloroflexota bacterium]
MNQPSDRSAAARTALTPPHTVLGGDGPGAMLAVTTSTAGACQDADHLGARLIANHGDLVQRLSQIFPGAATWFIVSVLFWGPLVFPWPLAIGILLFDLYWFGRSFSAAYHAVQGYWRLKAHRTIDWRDEYQKALDDGRVLVDWDAIHHVIIIPNLNEKVEKLRLTLQHLADQHYVSGKLTVVLAMEAKEEGAYEKADLLSAEFRESFDHIYATFHPSGIPGEVPGKSSNEAWAARWVKQRLVDQMGYDLDTITVTSCDADSLIHPRYFSCLTYKFATDSRRHRRFWQAPIFLYNNIWEVPMPIRVVSVLATIYCLGDLAKSHR